MKSVEERQVNQTAFRQLIGPIQTNYAPGRFVAISGGRIVADAARFDELNSILRQLGLDGPDVLVVQAGADYPENVTIFTLE
jgi:hypothetical protein